MIEPFDSTHKQCVLQLFGGAHMNEAHMNEAHMNEAHMNEAHMNEAHMNESWHTHKQ